jgi:arginine exporter protein ArgO
MQHKRFIYFLQVASMTYIWIFVLGVALWILNLIRVAHKLNDALNASVAISIVAIPLFFTLAAVLTYVFVGLQRGRKREDVSSAK